MGLGAKGVADRDAASYSRVATVGETCVGGVEKPTTAILGTNFPMSSSQTGF